MKPGYLVVMNDVAPGAESAFERWYQAEHLDERLAVPGFHNARRYIALEGAPRYAAIYELDDAAVLNSAPYRARLNAPTALTQSIMPSFRNMHRTAMQCDFRSVRGLGVLLDVVALARAQSAPVNDALLRELGRDPAFEGLALLSNANLPAVSGTTEGKLRSVPDAQSEALALVHWADLPDHRPVDPRPALEAAGMRPIAAPGGRYRLLAARGSFRPYSAPL